MARADLRLPDNAPGEYFVDSTCIDCDACRQIAPAAFTRSARHEQSIVAHQPQGEQERRRAAMALVTCPTSSIGTADKRDVPLGVASFPERITDDIFYCGFASADSFGASSYFVRGERENVLVDSPRAARPLLARLDALGGVQRMLLTHRDDVADHAVFHQRFGCERVIHRSDRTSATASVERVLEGTEPIRLDSEWTAIPVPGHTRGSTAFLFREKFLFAGDHLWADEEGHLAASRSVCWFSWPDQVRSLERLLDWRFEWVLPGHGRRYAAVSADVLRAELESLVRRFRDGRAEK